VAAEDESGRFASCTTVMKTSRLAVATFGVLCGVSLPVVAAAQVPEAQTQDAPALTRGADVPGALVDSLKIVLIEHGIRLAFQEKTRRELKGPFWSDYVHSIKIPHQWEDTDKWWVNYIGHPIHGAAAGYVWLAHDPGAPADISLGRSYWVSRSRALAWAAGYSLQFEVGPLSEASIGNVGLRAETTGWVDHVVTPVGAFGLIIAEDALDRYFVRWVERRTPNRVFRAVLRLVFNPGRTMSNSATGRLPWYRDGRPLSWK
jgi:hypothetical protein